MSCTVPEEQTVPLCHLLQSKLGLYDRLRMHLLIIRSGRLYTCLYTTAYFLYVRQRAADAAIYTLGCLRGTTCALPAKAKKAAVPLVVVWQSTCLLVRPVGKICQVSTIGEVLPQADFALRFSGLGLCVRDFKLPALKCMLWAFSLPM
jgi:hypothetical protein